MELFVIPGSGGRLFANLGDRVGFKSGQIPLLDRQSTPHLHRPRAAFFERCIIEVGKRLPVQDHHGTSVRARSYRHRESRSDRTGSARSRSAAHATSIASVRQSCSVSAAPTRDRGSRSGPATFSWQAAAWGKIAAIMIIGLHPLNRRRVLLATAKSQYGQRPIEIPTPTRRKERRRKHRLSQGILDPMRRKKEAARRRGGSCGAVRAREPSRRRWRRPAARS